MNKVYRIFASLLGNQRNETYELFDYLEHTGHEEYIKLPYQPNNRTRLVFKYSVPTITQECILFGSRDRGRTVVFYWYQNTNFGGSIFSRTGGGQSNFGNSFTYDWYEVVANTSMSWVRKRPGTATGDQTRSWDATEFTVPFNMYLFAINHNDAPIGTSGSNSPVNKIAGVKMSAIELYEDTELLMDLKPARRSDGRTGYLDVLNDVFYFSENEYDFNVGNYADEYIYYDYLENTSSSYINTEVYISTSLRIISKVGGRSGYTTISPFAGRDSVGVKSLLLRLRSDTPGYGGYITGALGGNTQHPFGAFVADEIYNVDINGKLWTITNSQGTASSHIFPAADFTSTIRTVCLFGFNLTGAANPSTGTIIGDTSIYDNGILVRNYKPAVRRWDGKVGMYEKVNNILYQSYTSTAFATYGNWS